MKARQAARAWEHLLGLEGPGDLWTSRAGVRADVLEALRHVNEVDGPWRDALVATARRRGITPAYIVDRALVFRAGLAAHGEPDLYAILGVSSDASPETIRRRWRHLAKRHHPDADGRRHADTFRRVHAAYAVLGNAVERMRYDARHRRYRPTHLQIEAHGGRRHVLPSPKRFSARHVAWGSVAVGVVLGLFRPAHVPEPVAVSSTVPIAPAPVVTPPAPPPAPRPPRVVLVKASRPVPAESPPPTAKVAAPAVVPVAVPARRTDPTPAVAPSPPGEPARRRSSAIDEVAANEFLGEFRRRYEAREALGLLDLFASNGAANGRRGIEIAEAYDEFFRHLQPRYTTGRVRVRATTAGAAVESEVVLTAHGRSPMRGVAYWDLVREGGRVRVARLVSSLPAL